MCPVRPVPRLVVRGPGRRETRVCCSVERVGAEPSGESLSSSVSVSVRLYGDSPDRIGLLNAEIVVYGEDDALAVFFIAKRRRI